MLRKIRTIVLLALSAAVLYLFLAPVPIEPQVWHASTSTGYIGVHAANQKLSKLKAISLDGQTGPEHVAFGPDNAMYLAVEGGKLLRIASDGSVPQLWAQTQGRILGFAFDAQGRIIAADAMRGLLAINADKDHSVSVLLDKFTLDGKADEVLFANSVVVAKSGKIYFTDSSRRFGAKAWGGTFMASVLDILEHSATGRVLEFDPVSKKVRLIMQDLCFANGIALSQDESTLFVAETGTYRVWKIDLATTAYSAKHTDSRSNGMAKVILENLPGYPDNLMRGEDGRIWLGFAKPRSDVVDKMANKTAFRKMTVRLPQALWPVPKPYGHVIAFDESGKVLMDMQDPSGSYPETTGVVETADKLYIQSLNASYLGWMEKPKF